jgi:hypothetical protein
MAAQQRNGARLGWLLIPDERAVEASRLWGDPLLPGLAIDLERIGAV